MAISDSRTNSSSHDDCENASTATGRTRWRSTSPASSVVASRVDVSPPGGSHCSFTANTHITISATQNTGAASLA